jgi:hypothetical protein
MKRSPVVTIGVDRHGVGRDDGVRRFLPLRLSESSHDGLLAAITNS